MEAMCIVFVFAALVCLGVEEALQLARGARLGEGDGRRRELDDLARQQLQVPP